MPRAEFDSPEPPPPLPPRLIILRPRIAAAGEPRLILLGSVSESCVGVDWRHPRGVALPLGPLPSIKEGELAPVNIALDLRSAMRNVTHLSAVDPCTPVGSG